ncbi:MAG: hypothetical protein AB8G95_09120 [Anaerolineae bacterium]
MRLNPYRSHFYILSISLLCVMALSLGACGRLGTEEEAPQIASTLTGEIPVSVIEASVVGQPIDLFVGPTNVADGTPVMLTMLGSFGPQVLRTQFENNQAYFLVPETMTTRAGWVDFVVTSGEAKGTATLHLLPDQPVEPITPLVGSRSIIADAGHWAMVVAIPFDRFGNPIAEGTPVDIRSLHPGKALRTYDSKISHLLAWERIYSGIKAGRTIIAANIDEVHGPEGILLEIPGWPVPFELESDPDTLPADGFQLMTLRTDEIVDQYNNMMPDGTLVNFVVDGPAGNLRVIPAQTVDGVAETIFQAPNDPGQYTIRAAVFGMESEPLVVEFTLGPAVSSFPIDLDVSFDKGELALTAGPITAELDQYVPDGTPVSFEITGSDQKTYSITAVTDAGYATATIRLIHLKSGPQQAQAKAGSGSGELKFTLP